ncbi:MAG: Lactoylglutathione lyase, partial [uncultured Nocardioides sp.]
GPARQLHHPGRPRPRRQPLLLHRRPGLGARGRRGGRGADVQGGRQGRALAVGRGRVRGGGRCVGQPGRRRRADHPGPQRGDARGRRPGARGRAPRRSRPRLRGHRAGVGRLLRLLRRSRRLPLGDRAQSRPHRTGGPPV